MENIFSNFPIGQLNIPIPEAILKACRKSEIPLPDNVNSIKIDLRKIINRKSIEMLELTKRAAKNNGISINTNAVYITNHVKIKVKCDGCNYEWSMSPGNIKSGKGCPKCGIIGRSKKRKLSIEDADNIAERKDGKCLSRTYVGAKSPMKWGCKNGHIWKATYNGIQQGDWCKKCSIVKRKERGRKTKTNRGVQT